MKTRIAFWLILALLVSGIGVLISCSSSDDDDDDSGDDDVASDDDEECSISTACNAAAVQDCGDVFGWSSVEECEQIFKAERDACANGAGYVNCTCSDCLSLTDCVEALACVEACWAANCE